MPPPPSSPNGTRSNRLHHINLISHFFHESGRDYSYIRNGPQLSLRDYMREWGPGLDPVPYSSESTDDMQMNDDRDEEDGIRSDIQSNERLLLSSARQNPTNTNTLIHSHNHSHNHDHDHSHGYGYGHNHPTSNPRPSLIAIPNSDYDWGALSLRRQNAIRRKRKARTEPSPEVMESLAKQIKKIIDAYVNMIEEIDYSVDKTRIFNCFYYSHLSIDDSLLFTTNFVDKLNSDMLKKHFDSFYIMSKKRRLVDLYPNIKRRKTIKNNNPTIHDSTSNVVDKDEVTAHVLNYRKSILNINYTSFLRPGSSFDMNDGTNILFSRVNYDDKSLKILFNRLPGNNNDNSLLKFIDFCKYFIYQVREDERSREKYKLLCKVVTKVGNHYQPHEIETKFQNNSFKYEADGGMIDFKNNDFRFLDQLNIKHDPCGNYINSSDIQNSIAQLQLLKWANLDPFVEIKQDLYKKKLDDFVTKAKTIDTDQESLLKSFPEFREFFVTFQELSKNVGGVGIKDKKMQTLRKKTSDMRRKLVQQFGLNSRYTYENRFDSSHFTRDYDCDLNLANRLLHLTACDQYCAFNIQLNFVLFTFKIDLHDFMDSSIKYLLSMFGNFDFETDPLGIINKQYDSDKTNVLAMIGSLNRKSGELQILNSKLTSQNIWRRCNSSRVFGILSEMVSSHPANSGTFSDNDDDESEMDQVNVDDEDDENDEDYHDHNEVDPGDDDIESDEDDDEDDDNDDDDDNDNDNDDNDNDDNNYNNNFNNQNEHNTNINTPNQVFNFNSITTHMESSPPPDLLVGNATRKNTNRYAIGGGDQVFTVL